MQWPERVLVNRFGYILPEFARVSVGESEMDALPDARFDDFSGDFGEAAVGSRVWIGEGMIAGDGDLHVIRAEDPVEHRHDTAGEHICAGALIGIIRRGDQGEPT